MRSKESCSGARRFRSIDITQQQVTIAGLCGQRIAIAIGCIGLAHIEREARPRVAGDGMGSIGRKDPFKRRCRILQIAAISFKSGNRNERIRRRRLNIGQCHKRRARLSEKAKFIERLSRG